MRQSLGKKTTLHGLTVCDFSNVAILSQQHGLSGKPESTSCFFFFSTSHTFHNLPFLQKKDI